MFANIIQSGAISSHVHDFPDTFCARYYGSSDTPFSLLTLDEKGGHKNKSALEGSLEILHPFLQLTKLVNGHHAASGSIVRTDCHPACSSYSPNLLGLEG